MPKLLDILDFSDNPFANYVAENEPDIESYFIRPPYYDTVTERGNASRSLIIFGSRGAGKSATRLTYYKDSWNVKGPGEKSPLVVTLDDFTRIAQGKLDRVNLGSFVSEVGYLIVEAALVWLAALDESEREVYLEAMSPSEEALVIALVNKFYLSRPEHVRTATIVEPLKLLKQAWHKRSALWVQNRWDGIVSVMSGLASGISKRKLEIDVNLDAGFSELLRGDAREWNEALFAKAIFSRFTKFSQNFGFSGVTVLVDKVDETQLTNNSADSTADLLYPLLVNAQVLEIEGFGWIFFLWDLVKAPYSSGKTSIRLDKIANASIEWEDKYLRDLVSQRLRHFSKNQVQNFQQMCDPAVDADAALEDIIRLSMRSPRELIRVMDTIVREHDDEHANKPENILLLRHSIDRALDKYTVDTIKRVFDKLHLQQLQRLATSTFINNDIQVKFKTNPQNARNRITAWSAAGLIAQTGTRAAEGGSGGKPAYEYSIIDQRVKRMVERTLSLGVDYDISEDQVPELLFDPPAE